ncbi:hypothetical protein [Paenibacillus sp. 32O-W]|nr:MULTISPECIES: hypothetical protein [Paenibacillaceae]
MNIGHLLRQWIGEARATEGKALELKAGQIVRGTVLQLLADQEAMLMIGGVKLRARLETPLQQGESTFLQVLAETRAGQIRLKPVQGVGTLLPEAPLLEMLKEFGLKDTVSNRQLLLWMQQSSVPLTRENVSSLSAMIARMPAGMPAEEWSQAAMLAVKRGLPLTETNVTALHQALFGKPPHEGLQQLAAQLKHSLEGQDILRPELRQLLNQALRATEGVIALGAARLPASAAAPAITAPVTAALPAASNPGAAPAGGEGAGAAAAVPGGPAPAPAPALQPPAAAGQAASGAAPGQASAAPAGAVPRAAVAGAAGPVPAEAPAGQPAQAAAAPQALPASAQAPVDRAVGPNAAAEPAVAAGQVPPAAAAAPGTAPSGEPSWVLRLLKAIGLDYERSLLQQAAKSSPDPAAGGRTAPAAGQPAPAAPGPDPAAAGAVPDRAAEASQSLKGALLQLSAADDLPPALREAVQQTLQQITGQQLLLAADRSSMFTHVTMTVPLFHVSGEQTAAVHIQTRKGKQGEMDSSNCRLLFDLRMAYLGPTIVDVQVTDRIVNIVVHSDYSGMEKAIEPFRQEVADRLEAQGYPFVSIRSLPFPDKKAGQNHAASGEDGGLSLYDTKPYKGVDLRI